MNAFTANVPVKPELVGDQVITAFEGGSNYWIGRVSLISPAAADIANPDGVVWWGRQALYEQPFDILIVEQEAHTAGASPEHHLTPEAVQHGLGVMATKYARHFGDMMNENGDATTADVFLQCCLFGDIIYG